MLKSHNHVHFPDSCLILTFVSNSHIILQFSHSCLFLRFVTNSHILVQFSHSCPTLIFLSNFHYVQFSSSFQTLTFMSFSIFMSNYHFQIYLEERRFFLTGDVSCWDGPIVNWKSVNSGIRLAEVRMLLARVQNIAKQSRASKKNGIGIVSGFHGVFPPWSMIQHEVIVTYIYNIVVFSYLLQGLDSGCRLVGPTLYFWIASIQDNY